MGNKRARLVADVTITAQDIKRAMAGYCNFKGSSDFWSLVCPPPGGPLSYSWKSPPNGMWLAKCAGLLFDLLAIAPNSKLNSSKVMAALNIMIDERTLSIPPGKVRQDFLDKLDTTIRILLSMVRCVRTNGSRKKNGVLWVRLTKPGLTWC